MAEITGIFATSHAPHIVREWDAIRAAHGEGMAEGFAELGRRITAARPDVIVAIGADHWANFFLDHMPAICIGLGDAHDGPPEPFLAAYPHVDMRGHPALALHLSQQLFGKGFEHSWSYALKLDHAFCVPFWKSGLGELPPVVPIIINAMQPPLTSMGRCIDFGAALADAIRAMPEDLRVVILASGGLSHEVGGPLMGEIDQDFDQTCLALLESGERAGLIGFLTDSRVEAAGNGAAEVRYWLAAHGAAAQEGFKPLFYAAIPEIYCGCAIGEWQIGG